MANIFESKEQFFATLKILREERKKGAERVGIFGSRKRGDHKPTSDVDIISEFEDSTLLGLKQVHRGDIHLISTQTANNDSGANLIRNTTRWLWKKKG